MASDFSDDGSIVSHSDLPGVRPGSKGGASEGFDTEIGELVQADGPPLRVVSARGTEDGLVLRIDGRAEWNEILGEIEAFFGSRRRFFEGGQVKVEWLERLPTKEQSQELEKHLEDQYSISILARRKRPSRTTITVERGAAKKDKKGVTVSLFESTVDSTGDSRVGDSSTPADSLSETIRYSNPSRYLDDTGRRGDAEMARRKSDAFGADTFGSDVFGLADRLSGERPSEIDAAAVLSIDGDVPGSGRKYTNRISHILGDDLQYEEDANTKTVFGTLRSGQRLETPFSLVVIGDVNPGADLVAGGDIFVLGSLRGTAHAGAYDDDCQDRIVFAHQMQPMQLRIGSVISRGSGETAAVAEVARVESRRIIVEAYNPRTSYSRKLR